MRKLQITPRLRSGQANYKLQITSVFFVIWCLVLGISLSYAQDNQRVVDLSKQIIEAKNNQDIYAPCEELKAEYFKENKYADFVEFIQSLGQKKSGIGAFVDYYTALARYYQLKYLEDTQSWDEYFNQGNSYRDQITSSLEKVISATTDQDKLNIKAKLLLWRFHKDREDTMQEGALDGLTAAVTQYAKGPGVDTSVIKGVADELLGYSEKIKARILYKIYVDKLVTSEVSDVKLNESALTFYNEGNLELAQNIYDVYLERITKILSKESVLTAMKDIAQKFAYKDNGPKDPAYAEKVFQKIEDSYGGNAFDEKLTYVRAINLEKTRDYKKAKDIYLDLIKRYPLSMYTDEADYKIAVINTYVLRDAKAGKGYFEKLSLKEQLSPQVISSLYELGLLSQWQEDFIHAKEYYNKLLEKVKDGYAQMVGLAKERLKEIEDKKAIEYNLRMFLDLSLKEEYSNMDMTRLQININPSETKIDQNVDVSTDVFAAPTGCLQLELQYLWSGDLGVAKPLFDESAFNTSYASLGTKLISLVVVSPTGILDRAIGFIDIRQ